MKNQILKSISPALFAVYLVSCTTVETGEDYSDESFSSADTPMVAENTTGKFDAEAYEKGVQDVLNDMRGRLSVNNSFVFMPPLKECGVWIPTSTINGVVVPAHETCVVYAPGYYAEKEHLYQVEGVKP